MVRPYMQRLESTAQATPEPSDSQQATTSPWRDMGDGNKYLPLTCACGQWITVVWKHGTPEPSIPDHCAKCERLEQEARAALGTREQENSRLLPKSFSRH